MDAASEEPTATAKVASLFIYPIKSCRGIQVPHAPLTHTGFRWDRNWLVVNEKGRGYTQRVEPKLALVQVELPNDAFDERWEPTKDSFMVLNAPGMQALKICMNKQHEVADGVPLWEWGGSAWFEGAEAAQWFTDFLGKPSSLIRFTIDSQARLADRRFNHNGELICFTDGNQFLVISQVNVLDSQITRTTMNAASEEPTAKVASLFIYPVKSCRGIQVPHAPLTRTGFRWDRNWLVVNGKGRGYTQRIEPKLALVQVELPSKAFDEGWEPTKDSFMVLNAPGMQPLKICMNKHGEEVEGVSLWEWSGSAWYEGPEAAQWFTDFLGKPSSLIRFNIDSQARLADPQFYHNSELTCFSDGYQFLVISQGSMDVINQHASEPIPINRFRPNFLVEGCEPFSEDIWKKIKISKFSFESARLCYRCKVPQVNQETGVVGQEPAQTLQKIRSDKILRPNGAHNKNLTYVGQFIAWNKEETAAPEKGKIIKVGDPIYVLERVNSFADAIA